MRQTYAFLLTVLPAESGANNIRGRVKLIATGCETNFTSMEQLAEILRNSVSKPQPSVQEKTADHPTAIL